MINIEKAKEIFRIYLDQYDKKDDKIHLKMVHTFCVLDAADFICREEMLGEEDHHLAVLIALLHDIGRFEQIKEFQSFDDRRFNHADFGVKVLFEDGLIREFVEDRGFDEIIRKAIACHSLYALPDDLSDRERLHCKIIRDADKLDNFRVKETEAIETFFDVPEEVVANELIGAPIMEAVRAHHCVRAEDRVTHMDFWVSFLAFIFDLNFPASFRWIKGKDYLNRNVDRISYGHPQTMKDMEEVRAICNAYVDCKCAIHNHKGVCL